MKNTIIIILVLLTAIVIGFYSCQKKMFGHVEVNGRVLDYYTNEPIEVEVSLMADDATSAKSSTEGTVKLATMITNSNGKFKLKSRRSKRNKYYINVFGGAFKEISIEDNQNNDLGDFIAGSHEFICNIKVIPRSDSSMRFKNYYFTKGTTATIQDTIKMYSSTYSSNNGCFPIRYTTYCFYPAHYSTNYNLYVPITSLTSLLTATIYY